MSKGALAIEGVMQIFLMIAVIVVGMAFLLKAFGIDIFGWLQDRLGVFGLPDSGRALYVRLDTNPKKIFEFRLTSDEFFLVDDEAAFNEFKSYFYLSEFPTGKCTILSVEYNGAQQVLGLIPLIERRDKGGIYYVLPGTLLQNGCTSIRGCIEATTEPKWNLCDFREAIGKVKGPCDTKCSYIAKEGVFGSYVTKEGKCSTPYSYVDCDPGGANIGIHRDYHSGLLGLAGTNFCDYERSRPTSPSNLEGQGDVINEVFNNDQGWKCEGQNCNLLDKENKVYEIKYGIVCDDKGKWQACNPEKEKNKVSEGSSQVSGLNDCRCEKNGDNMFAWEGSCSPTQITSQITLSSPANGEITSKTPVLTTSEVSGANRYYFYTRTITQTRETPLETPVCSQTNSVVPTALYYGTVYWSAKACSDTSCNECKDFAAERYYNTEKLTESTIGWSLAAGITVGTDFDNKQVGENSIKFSANPNFGSKSVTNEFTRPVSVAEKVSFYADSDWDRVGVLDLTITLADANNNKASKNVGVGLSWRLNELSKSDFQIAGSTFDWNQVKSVTLTGIDAYKILWLDGLYFQ